MRNKSKNLCSAFYEAKRKTQEILNDSEGKKGNLQSHVNKVMEYLKEYLNNAHMNTTFQNESKALNHIYDAPNNEESLIPNDEIKKAVRSMKRGKTAGNDEITAEVIKAAGDQ